MSLFVLRRIFVVWAFIAQLSFGSSVSALIIDFERTPPLNLAPSFFSSAGPAQTISFDGVNLSGGVVLSLPSFLPASVFSTSPNLYGTANHPSGGAVGDPSLQSTIRIQIDPLLGVTTVDGLLINGLIDSDDFIIQAYSGPVLVDSVSLVGISANSASGNDVFRLDAGADVIDLVTIQPDLGGPFAGEWDYFLDTLAIGEPIENLLRVAEPTPLALLVTGVGLFAFRVRRC